MRFRTWRAGRREKRPDDKQPGRTVAELLEAAERHCQVRKREEARRRAEEQARQERERAAAREKHLNGLVGREEQLWLQIEHLVEAKRGAEYDQALATLKGLRDLAARSGDLNAFRTRIVELRERHLRKPAFIGRIDQAGLAKA
jgi:hypothetical protein